MQVNVKKILEDAINEKKKEFFKQATILIEKDISRISNIIDKDFFKMIVNNVIDKEDRPTTIDGILYNMPSRIWTLVDWMPLSERTIQIKKHNRKWFHTGVLKNYFLAADPYYFYRKPIIRHDLRSNTIVYYSPFSWGENKHVYRRDIRRRLFGKLPISNTYNEELRPMIAPMERFYVEEYAPFVMRREINESIERLERMYK